MCSEGSDAAIILMLDSGGSNALTKGVSKWLIIPAFWFLYWGIRFSLLPDKEIYRDLSKHIGYFVHGIPSFAAIVALSAGIVTLI